MFTALARRGHLASKALKRRPVLALTALVFIVFAIAGPLGDIDFINSVAERWFGPDWLTKLVTSRFLPVTALGIAALLLWQISVDVEKSEMRAAEQTQRVIDAALKPLKDDIISFHRLRDIDRCLVHLDKALTYVNQARVNIERFDQEEQIHFGDTMEMQWRDIWRTAMAYCDRAVESLKVDAINRPNIIQTNWIAHSSSDMRFRVVKTAENPAYIAQQKENIRVLEQFIANTKSIALNFQSELLDRNNHLDR